MFSTAIKGGKAFTAEQKLKELKKYIYIQAEVFRKKKLSKTKTTRDISKSF